MTRIDGDARSRVVVGVALVMLLVSALDLASVLRSCADPLPTPPAEAEPGIDYAAEPDDSVEAGSIAVGYGLSGRIGRTPGRSRSLRFRGDSIEAGVRDGEVGDDADGDLSSRGRGRVLRIGRIAPAWGRGLLVGAPPDPWVARTATRAAARAIAVADPFAPHARAGDGVACAWPRRAIELFGGRLGGREAAGAVWSPHGLRTGVLAARGHALSASAGIECSDRALECAIDPRGHVRAEAIAVRETGRLAVALRAGAGHPEFRSPLALARRVPARTATVALRGTAGARGALEARATFAGWRYMRGVAGARAGVEATWREGARSALGVGFEEQHGVWRAPAGAVPKPAGMRQGAWVEWRGAAAGCALNLRDEWWGRRPFARGRVREAVSAGAEASLPAGAGVGVTHTVYRARAGETVYLPEHDGDRWVLRALSGAGTRTRASLRLPLAEGTLTGVMSLGRSRGVEKRQWSLQWSRRIRLRRAG